MASASGLHKRGRVLRFRHPSAETAPGYPEPPMTRVRPPKGRPPPKYPPGRRCATDSCTARLSIYNPVDNCRLHSPRLPPKRSRQRW